MAIQHVYNAADWGVTVGGIAIRWQKLEFTFENFHVPASFAVEAPLDAIDILTVLADKAPEMVIKRLGKEFFVGQLDDSHVHGDEEIPEGLLNVNGRDLAAKFILKKIDEPPPMNLTSSQLVALWAKDLGFKDMSGITPTSTLIGEFLKTDTSHVTRGMNRHAILFDLANAENFVFRVHRRRVYFGPAPAIPTGNVRQLGYQKNFNDYDWRKNHTNADIQVRVMGTNGKKTKVSQTAGDGGILIERIILDRRITPLEAKNIADKLLAQMENGLVTLGINNLPGDHTIDDVNFAFNVSGIAKGVDARFEPARIHNVLTQDDHVMDLDMYNKRGVAVA